MTKLSPPWNSLEVAKLAASLLTPLLLFWLGYETSQSIQRSEELREDLQKQQRLEQTRQSAVQSFSKFIYERRARAELLASALKRHASSPTLESRAEVVERKKLYDKAYFRWNSNHQANLLLVRQVLGSEQYSDFESIVDERCP